MKLWQPVKKNEENIRNNISDAATRLNDIKNEYYEISRNANNWLLNIFRSKETKEKLQTEVNEAQRQLEYAQLEYDEYRKIVISYETIMQRNEKNGCEEANIKSFLKNSKVTTIY